MALQEGSCDKIQQGLVSSARKRQLLSACNFRSSFLPWQSCARIRPSTSNFLYFKVKNFRFPPFGEIGVTLVLELKRPLRLRRPSKLITKTSFRYQFGAENGFSCLQTGPMKPNNSYRKELRLEFVVSVSRATPI
jgi:hypothetical protein